MESSRYTLWWEGITLIEDGSPLLYRSSVCLCGRIHPKQLLLFFLFSISGSAQPELRMREWLR